MKLGLYGILKDVEAGQGKQGHSLISVHTTLQVQGLEEEASLPMNYYHPLTSGYSFEDAPLLHQAPVSVFEECTSTDP